MVSITVSPEEAYTWKSYLFPIGIILIGLFIARLISNPTSPPTRHHKPKDDARTDVIGLLQGYVGIAVAAYLYARGLGL
jgi:hypothetical protein